LLCIFIRIITIGHSFKDGKPLTGCRKPILKVLYQACTTIFVFLGAIRKRKTIRKDYDYSSYLGPDYKNDYIPEHIPTYISNHTSWMDVGVLVAYYAPAFVSKKSLRKVPVFGLIC